MLARFDLIRARAFLEGDAEEQRKLGKHLIADERTVMV
jgi:hypothetical protein